LKLRGFLASILRSFLSSSATGNATAPEQQTSISTTKRYRKFVVYYGWYSNGKGELLPEIERIIAAQPEFVVSPYHTSDGRINLSPRVIGRLHEAGVKILAYVTTANGNRDLGDVLREIRIGLEADTDGIFLDEVSMLQSDRQVNYFREIYYDVKSFGSDRIVITNPGSILVNEKVMAVSDIVSFEHQWRLAPHIDWFSRYPATRFMGISSNDIEDVMGYRVDGNVAARDTIEAWQRGIGYHYSTNTYTTLAPWFEEYQRALEDYGSAGTTLHELQLKTIHSDGSEIKTVHRSEKRAREDL